MSFLAGAQTDQSSWEILTAAAIAVHIGVTVKISLVPCAVVETV